MYADFFEDLADYGISTREVRAKDRDHVIGTIAVLVTGLGIAGSAAASPARRAAITEGCCRLVAGGSSRPARRHASVRRR